MVRRNVYEFSCNNVNWNLKADTNDCIESILEPGASLSQTIIVDKCSTDGSITAIKNYFRASIHIIKSTKNLSLVPGSNRYPVCDEPKISLVYIIK
jgi:GT2 family glycosyltransferase